MAVCQLCRAQVGKQLIELSGPPHSRENLYIVTQEKKRFLRARPGIGTWLVKRCWFEVINGYHGCHILEDVPPGIQFIMKKILVIGAHPDDCDIFAGGCAALWRERGDEVSFVSMTNGNAGHHQSDPAELAKRRAREAAKAGEILGVDYEILDNDDGRLLATLERGAIVTSDRYLFSSLAYQSLDTPFELVVELNRQFVLPRHLFFLDTLPEICQQRVARRQRRELFELAEAQQRLRDSYQRVLDYFADGPLQVHVVDGAGSRQEVFARIWGTLEDQPILTR